MPLLIGACLMAFDARGDRRDRDDGSQCLARGSGTPQLFDVASRAEIMMFAHQLLESENLSDVRSPNAWGCVR